MGMYKTESDLREAIYDWIWGYCSTHDKKAIQFALVSRRWSRCALGFGRPLQKIMTDDIRFAFVQEERGGFRVSLRTAEEAKKIAEFRRMWAEAEAEDARLAEEAEKAKNSQSSEPPLRDVPESDSIFSSQPSESLTQSVPSAPDKV